MADWIRKLDDFIRISEREILTHAGTISHETALSKTEAECEAFRAAQASLSQPVDQHFSKALGELTKIATSRRPRRKPVRKQR
jgi:hypothetical protein